MQCFKCNKEMDRDAGAVIKGVVITITCEKPEDICYINTQLGKYSDGAGNCDIGICYECYIDVQFGVVNAQR